ncbi:hypothetical protein BGZ65_006160 [Modicella reniformis]|uniref:Vacuolar protein sorting-associated protein 16 homolog n=1 Tax=Modicella reniformis TaxID=1440133 RepID=A0A9P6IN25_9FUNG|nr:hypothetical protein BGZ65_006160 [Modicella reniformis]
MSVSPNGKYLALFTSEGKLWVVSTDFQKNLLEFDTQSKLPPHQLAWSVYSNVFFRLHKMESIGLDATENIFKIGSTTPAAMLYDALDSFEKKLSKADENIRSIRLELSEAVEACIEAAGHEFTHYYQRLLLKAASFGKSFLEIHNADSFVEMCKILRVLNAVRFYEIGIPLTYVQYQSISPDALIDRLICRHQYLLAIKICEYLKMRTDRILIHWACSKIKKSCDDEDTICRMIVDKLANKPGLSYSEIAMTAYVAGRYKLATMVLSSATKLLDYEPRAGDQVPLLMSMKQDELALTKAIESGDTHLVYYVLLHLKRKLDVANFINVVSKKPLACNLLEAYCKEQNTKENTEFLKKFYRLDDRTTDKANLTLIESFQLKDTAQRIDMMKEAGKLYDKEHTFEAKAVEDAIRLIQVQAQLEKEYGELFTGLSISSTVYKLITINQSTRANKVRSDFKMPDKRFWWIKLRALVEIRDWEGVAAFAKFKKSPIGYEPFVEECVKARQFTKVGEYILKCDPHLRAGLFLKIEAYNEAGEQAYIQKDMEMLQYVSGQSQCELFERLHSVPV